MGGPSCLIVLREAIPGEALVQLRNLLASCGDVRPGLGDDTLEVRASSDDETIAAFVGIDDLAEAATAEFCERVSRAIGWSPAMVVETFCMNGSAANHPFLGRVALRIAETYGGFIELVTPCSIDDAESGPPHSLELRDSLEEVRQRVHPEDRDQPHVLISDLVGTEPFKQWQIQMRDWYRSRVRERMLRVPGRAVELSNGRGNVSYLVDSTYMQVWLRDPNFFFE